MVESSATTPQSDAGESTAGELLPCPFCGEEGILSVNDLKSVPGGMTLYRGMCSECSCELCEWHEIKDDAITVWNTRTPAVPPES